MRFYTVHAMNGVLSCGLMQALVPYIHRHHDDQPRVNIVFLEKIKQIELQFHLDDLLDLYIR